MSKILSWIYDHKWAITAPALEAIVQIASRNIEAILNPKVFHANYDMFNKKALELIRTPLLEGTRSVLVRDGVAIIPIVGPIIPRSDFFTEISGITSVESISQDFQKALKSDEIHSIILDVDSPGGEITGIGEFSDMIFQAQGTKPIVTFISGIGASGAYWIGSSTNEILLHETSEVGSIGVVAVFRDTTAKDEKEGIKKIEIVSSISPNKRPDINTEEGKGQIQKIVDDLGEVFVAAVARNRGTTKKDVLKNFGQGGMIVGEHAVEIGLADRVNNLETIITELSVQHNSTNNPTGGKNMSKLLKEATVADVKTENPALYESIKAETQPDIKVAKDEGFKEGVNHENKRIQDIEALSTTETQEIVEANKFDTAKTKGDVAVLIAEDKKKQEKGAAEDIDKDAKDLGEQSSQVDTSSPSKKDAHDATVNNMVAGGNAYRESRRRK